LEGFTLFYSSSLNTNGGRWSSFRIVEQACFARGFLPPFRRGFLCCKRVLLLRFEARRHLAGGRMDLLFPPPLLFRYPIPRPLGSDAFDVHELTSFDAFFPLGSEAGDRAPSVTAPTITQFALLRSGSGSAWRQATARTFSFCSGAVLLPRVNQPSILVGASPPFNTGSLASASAMSLLSSTDSYDRSRPRPETGALKLPKAHALAHLLRPGHPRHTRSLLDPSAPNRGMIVNRRRSPKIKVTSTPPP